MFGDIAWKFVRHPLKDFAEYNYCVSNNVSNNGGNCFVQMENAFLNLAFMTYGFLKAKEATPGEAKKETANRLSQMTMPALEEVPEELKDKNNEPFESSVKKELGTELERFNKKTIIEKINEFFNQGSCSTKG